MLSQQKSAIDFTAPPVRAFAAILRSHGATTRRLSAELQAQHGLTISDFEALLLLAHAEGGRMKRVELSRSLLLTPSGVTRLLEGLERAGFVRKEACESDLRVTYAVLTEEGREAFAAAAADHVESIGALFGAVLGDDDLVALAELLERLPGVADGNACTPGDASA